MTISEIDSQRPDGNGRTRRRVRRTTIHAVCLAVCLAAVAASVCAVSADPALGWWSLTRPGTDFDTHDWVLVEANRLAGIQGDGWVVMEEALPVTDDPDSVFGDWAHHFYDVWGNRRGDAPQRIAELYREAVRLRAAGDTTAASTTVGLMSHYYADICQPFHTSAPQSPSVKNTHVSYEKTVEEYTDAPGKNRVWIAGDGTDYIGDATPYAVSSDYAAHPDYLPLITRYREHGFDTRVRSITRAGLNRAAGGLADMIASINAEAGVHRLATSTLTAETPDPETISFGGTTALSGRLALDAGAVPRTTLILRVRGTSGAWRDADTITCGDDGTWSYSARPEHNTRYRVHFAGDTEHLHATSTGFVVRVRPVVVLLETTQSHSAGHIAGMSVTVRPPHPRRLVQIQRRIAGSWRTVAQARLGRYSRAVWRWLPPRAGVYRLRAVLPAHSRHLSGISSTVTAVVTGR